MMARSVGMVYQAIRGGTDGSVSSTLAVPPLEESGSFGVEDVGEQGWIGAEGLGQRTAILGELMRMVRRN